MQDYVSKVRGTSDSSGAALSSHGDQEESMDTADLHERGGVAEEGEGLQESNDESVWRMC